MASRRGGRRSARPRGAGRGAFGRAFDTAFGGGGEDDEAGNESEAELERARPEPADWMAEPEPEEPPPGPRRSDTLARVLWALPWIVFAITIVAVGGLLFAAAMVLFACAGMNEYFLMTKRARPLAPVAYVAAGAIILVAHYQDQYEILMLLLATLP